MQKQIMWIGAGFMVMTAAAQGQVPRGFEEARGAKARDCVRLAQEAMGSGRGPIENFALQDIAVTQASFGDVGGALKTTSAVDDTSDRIRALVAVAKVQRSKGDEAGSRETMKLAVRELGRGAVRMRRTPWGPPTEDPRNLHEIGVGEASIGDPGEALRLARMMPPTWEKVEVLARVGEFYVAHGDPKEAKKSFGEAKLVMHFVNDPMPPFGFGDIAYLEVAAGWLDDARATAQSQLSKLSVAGTLAVLALREAQAQHVANAQAFLKDARQAFAEAPPREDTRPQRAKVAADIALAHFAAGERGEAKRMIGEAVKAAESIPVMEGIHSLALADVSIAAQKCGEDGAARGAWDRAVNDLPFLQPGDRVQNLWAIAVKKAWAGDAAAARAMAADAIRSGLVDPMDTAMQARGISAGIVRTEGVNADVTWIAGLLDRREQAAAYAAAAAEIAGRRGP